MTSTCEELRAVAASSVETDREYRFNPLSSLFKLVATHLDTRSSF